ncbi:MAG: hypothetical protein MUE72_06740 [Chitinophagaceae bacterium]|jgi:hypothetical protein|nr:hypothetical protein [Chitinophagaceae bacterium]
MKKILQLAIAVVLFASCSKQNDIIEPSEPIEVNQLFFKDNNLAVYSIKAVVGAANTNKIDFSTLYEKNITKLELMSGETPNYLCAIHTVHLATNSSQLKNYSVVEDNPKSGTMYYMIRYSLANGDWGYTNVLKFQRGN